MIPVELTINGKKISAEVEPRTLLATFLREHLGLTGTHIGCDTTQCGCCTVRFNGDAVKSCTMLVVQAIGGEVATIEGLAGESGELHPLQRSFMECHGLQCGFCTPGFIMNALDIIEKHDDLDEDKVRHLIDGNMCRCTGYNNIVDAILRAASTLRSASPETTAA